MHTSSHLPHRFALLLSCLALTAGCGTREVPSTTHAVASADSSGFLDPEPVPESGRLSALRPHFDRYVDVFGVLVVATPTVEERKIRHAAAVLAEWLDNDEDGVPDDERVQQVLIEEVAVLVMTDTEHELDLLIGRLDEEVFDKIDSMNWQNLYGEETRPDGPPHSGEGGRFDGALEEVLHLVTSGWEVAYPEALGYGPGSRLTDAMDLARGGRFSQVPQAYPEEAWYHYDDRTCSYKCMAAEYLYWAVTSYLGGQDFPGRAEEIAIEWECPTPELLAARDRAVFELVTDPNLSLPRTLPDGVYAPTPRR
jgi:hypothetical protein